MVEGRPISYPLLEENEFAPDPEEIRRRITEKTKMIVINSPSNPLGSVIDRKTLESIAEIALEHDLIVLSDEAYERIIYDGLKHYSIASFPGMMERTITVFSCSKTYAMTGWRLGYAVGIPEIIREMSKLQEHVYSHPTSISQKAAMAAVLGPQEFVSEMVREYDKRRKLIVRMLNEMDGVKCLMPKGAFYVFPNIKAFGLTSEDMATYLIREAKIATVPGNEFGAMGEGYLRISYAVSTEKIEEGMKRMDEALKKLK